ncbi:MAG: GDP-mannose 4,6-dehydratase [Gemmatimonadota bacterium]|nr:GDP-mannose 4,6-dehydratase [Gemmatimonadota bacterium]MDH3366410.1 GDP-mannose 4,6-dehydratase [Gemmatimonadota bacterium]MDH3478954.1 GDP-mannose 4,6-dehydratase [Gemmatimonadota bacterium]MDH3571721.1 GDP-mannose 4,6-dehydratase [Gemmatimonadota bacterium]MDH5550444.1 GDP-mannose 4,6-dehydratase [Gemmatimonadota bacterium]
MRVLVTGADGFAGIWLVRRLRKDGHEVVAAVRPDRPLWVGAPPPWDHKVHTVPFELLDAASVRGILSIGFDAVVHLAAVASGGDARQDPTRAWEINALGTARLAEELGRRRTANDEETILMVASTAEVYGAGSDRPRMEEEQVAPCSPYAASKLAAENAALEVHRRTGLRVVISRSFPHTGKGQDERFVVPAFARRLIAAKRGGLQEVRVGNLTPVREFMHVSDVVSAYVDLLRHGVPGHVYNVGGGEAVSLNDLFLRLAAIVGVAAEPKPDPDLVRPADIPHLVGDASKLAALTGWAPSVSLQDTLAEVVNAQTR